MGIKWQQEKHGDRISGFLVRELQGLGSVLVARLTTAPFFKVKKNRFWNKDTI